MTNREHALMAYFATIAYDPKVRLAESFEDVFRGVAACLREDLPAVLGRMGLGAIELAREKARGIAETLGKEVGAGASDVIDDIARGVGRWLGGVFR